MILGRGAKNSKFLFCEFASIFRIHIQSGRILNQLALLRRGLIDGKEEAIMARPLGSMITFAAFLFVTAVVVGLI